MANEVKTQHRQVLDTALPYIPNASVVSDAVCYRAGSNVMTSIRGYAEKRPGFAATAADLSSDFGSFIENRFLWNTWDGTFYEMLATDYGSLYKRTIGTDATFQGMLLTAVPNTGDTAIYDFAVANNHLFISIGGDAPSTPRKWNGISLSATDFSVWGIVAPTQAVVPALAGGALTATKGYRYVIAWEDSTTGHISSPSPVMDLPTVPVAQNVTITGNTTADTQVTHVRIYRTADGGSVYFEHPDSPVTYASWIATGYTDSTADNALTTQVAPLQHQNDPPPHANGLVWNAGRLWMFLGDKVYFSGWEEIPLGTSDMPEACFPPDNYFPFGEEVIGLGVAHDPSEQGIVMVFCAGSVHTISGDSLDTFKRSTLARNKGTRNRRTITSNGKIVAWLDTSNTVQISDGHSIQELSIPIRPDIETIHHNQAAMTFYDDGLRHWLVLLDGNAGKLRVYDQDKEQWMVPWSVSGCSSISSGESRPGMVELLLGSNLSPLELDPTVYTDNGVGYTGSLTTALGTIAEDPSPDSRGYVDYISVERNDVTLSDVSFLLDDEPLSGTFNSVFANERNPPYRTNGNALIEKQYPTERGPVGRRCSVKFDWDDSATNFKLFSYDIAYREKR